MSSTAPHTVAPAVDCADAILYGAFSPTLRAAVPVRRSYQRKRYYADHSSSADRVIIYVVRASDTEDWCRSAGFDRVPRWHALKTAETFGFGFLYGYGRYDMDLFLHYCQISNRALQTQMLNESAKQLEVLVRGEDDE